MIFSRALLKPQPKQKLDFSEHRKLSKSSHFGFLMLKWKQWKHISFRSLTHSRKKINWSFWIHSLIDLLGHIHYFHDYRRKNSGCFAPFICFATKWRKWFFYWGFEMHFNRFIITDVKIQVEIEYGHGARENHKMYWADAI